jgi:hypothetical protein
MSINRERAADACQCILGSKIYFALKSARVSLPKLLEMSAIQCFLDEDTGEDAEVVRAALIQLNETGMIK